ncbi:uncharacterized protein DUF4163 [Gillisia sp. Hel_I_86]|uniref:DUF3298 and DUF4163 domain-containing protein n=1 Tax=Gillisia sp. Hel_I_86 TaxID=1249981 RepID=UPI0011993DC8|nr:DUF3298 and DUF4163 domain-containing protein [Gillisia sp. Hel_I_86]TVZ26208.1 uncharacterized protein DUF4163 [Gillisia sp. Hel_I_86]
MKKLVLVLTLNLLFLGCNKDVPKLSFDELNIEQVSEMNCNPEEENCTFIGIKVPWAMGKDTRSNLLNSHIEDHIIKLIDYQDAKELNSLENLAQTFIDDYEASAKEFAEYNIPWEAFVEGKVTYESEKLISIQFDLALFTGGAHGYTSITFLNFNPETGRLLSNKELFSQDFKDFAEKRFRKNNDIPENESINSTGFFFEGDKFQLPQNIGFYPNKVVLRYNAYEIASYSEGNIQLVFKMEEAKKYFKIL